LHRYDEDLLGADFGKKAAGGNASDGEGGGGGFSPRAVSPEPASPRGSDYKSDEEDDGGGTPDRSFSPEAIRAREDEPEYLEVGL
jgi:hypothetical protein